MKRNNNRKGISIVLSLLISIFTFILILTTVTKFTIVNPNYLMSKMEKADFYQETIKNLNEHIQQETQSSGFPLEMFENYIDEKKGEDILKEYFNNAFNYGKVTISTDDFETKLSNDIDEYLQSANIIVNSKQQEAVNTLKSILIDYYQSYLSFPYLDMVYKLISGYNDIYPYIAIALVVLISIATIILHNLYHHYHSRRRYFAYALLTTGTLTFLLPGIIYFGNFVNKISLSPKYFYVFITSVLNTYLLIFIILGIVLIVLGYLIAYIRFKHH